jgi:dTDP-4-dehydrorhamnose reductase
MEERPLILITGANGQLGQAFKFLQPQFQDFDILWMDRSQLDITKAADVRKTLESVMPDVVINCAAYTNVEKAEEEAELAMLQNGTAPAFLAVACSLTGARLIHLSTDYVFDGSKQTPYGESDPTGPLSVYGHSKLAGERAIHSAGGDYWIFRVAWLYSPFAHNFYKTMIKLAQEKPELHLPMPSFWLKIFWIFVANPFLMNNSICRSVSIITLTMAKLRGTDLHRKL